MLGTLSNARIDDQQIRDDGTKRYRVVATYAGPSAYPTGGDSLLASDLNANFGLSTLTTIDDVLPSNPFYNGTNIFEATYNSTNNALQFFDSSTKVEVTNNTNLSTYTGRIEFVCH